MGGSFFRSRGFAIDTLAILVGAIIISSRPSAAWIERAYSNGAYPVWQHAISAIASPLPFSLGDVVGAIGVGIAVWIFAHNLRGARKGKRLAAVARACYGVAALAAVYAGWFEVSWG